MGEWGNYCEEIGGVCKDMEAQAARIAELEQQLSEKITGETSDGYHTFNELYHHRAVLFSVICRCERARFEFLPNSISTESDRKTIEENTIVFEEEVYPTKIVTEKGFFVGEEVGYQRKGANKRFYDDGKWDNNTVVIDRETLLDDWEKYFSDEDDAYYGKNAKQHFKENIIDKFVDGETIVCYW